MSIHLKNGCRDLLVRAFDLYGQRLNGMKMAEFGNQKLKFDPGRGARRLQIAKAYFEFFGIRHVSFDLNGRSGALDWDLGKPFDPTALYDATGIGMGEFDIVTNFGTIEHIEEPDTQVVAFKNAHDLCRRGGLMVHAMPAVGTCRKHGVWKYSAAWFADLAVAMGYGIEYLTEWDKCQMWRGRLAVGKELYVLAILRKQAYPEPDFHTDWPGNPTREK